MLPIANNSKPVVAAPPSRQAYLRNLEIEQKGLGTFSNIAFAPLAYSITSVRPPYSYRNSPIVSEFAAPLTFSCWKVNHFDLPTSLYCLPHLPHLRNAPHLYSIGRDGTDRNGIHPARYHSLRQQATIARRFMDPSQHC